MRDPAAPPATIWLKGTEYTIGVQNDDVILRDDRGKEYAGEIDDQQWADILSELRYRDYDTEDLTYTPFGDESDDP